MGMQDAGPSSMPRNEMGIGLTLEETEVFCEVLYNLAKGNLRTKDPVKIDFSGDNNAVSFGARRSYVKLSEAASRRLAQTIIIEPVISAEGVAKISLQSQADQSVFFCSAILTSKDALILAHMLRYDYHEAFSNQKFRMIPRKSSRSSLPNMGEKPEPGSDSPRVPGETMSAETKKTDAIKEILDQAKLGKPIELHQFEAAKSYWTEITKELNLPRFESTLVAFLRRNDELITFFDPSKLTKEFKFVPLGELEFVRRSKPVLNLGEVIFFAQELPKKLETVAAESRQIAREMLAVLLLECCYANSRKSCLNPRTDELAELLYPELKGKLRN
jgi:hypothetical protein